MSEQIPGEKALQRHAWSSFCSVSKFSPKSSITSKILVTVQKHVLKLILKSTYKFRKVSRI